MVFLFSIGTVLLLAGEAFMGISAAQEAALVEMTDDNKYDPERVTIRAGETVKWTNPSKAVHTVTADPAKAATPDHVELPPNAEVFDSGNIQPGGTYSHKFDVPGRYKYFCIPHEKMGMIGEVEVRPAG